MVYRTIEQYSAAIFKEGKWMPVVLKVGSYSFECISQETGK